MKTLMILGAGVYQEPLIQKAKEMGLHTIAVSIPGHYPGLRCADEVLYLDTRDVEGILAAARDRAIDGICTAGTDVAVRAIGAVCDGLGLSGISRQAARIVTDKWEMKEAFRRGGVSTAAFFRVSSPAEARDAADALGYPICLKAVDSSGSRGIRKVESEEELLEAWEFCRSATRQEYLLAEEYIDAVEIGADGFIQNGHAALCLPHAKDVCRAGRVTIPSGHRFPFRGGAELTEKIHREIERAAAATGIDNCPFNADLFIRGSRIWVIELGGRSGATCIPELISLHCGFDYYEQMIRGALGETPAFPIRQSVPCMSRLLFLETGGVLAGIDPAPLSVLSERGVRWKLDYRAGERLPAAANGTDRIGHVIAATDREEELEEDLRLLRSSLEIL